jgi:hypothetical protein
MNVGDRVIITDGLVSNGIVLKKGSEGIVSASALYRTEVDFSISDSIFVRVGFGRYNLEDTRDVLQVVAPS